MFGAQRTHVCGERSREHVDAPIHQIHGGGSLAGQSIQRGIDGEIMANVGDVDADFVVSVDLTERTGVIDVHTADWIDAHHVVRRADVFAPFQIALFVELRGNGGTRDGSYAVFGF